MQKIINIDELEYITGYNFLSNIPTEIQESIEKQSVGDIKAKLRAIITSNASLMAATEENLFPLAERTHLNATIGHGGIPNQIETSTKRGIGNSSISEVSISQNRVLKSINTSSTEKSTSGIDVIQVGSAQIGLNQITPMQVGREQTSIPNNSAFQIGFYQDSPSQISPSQIGFSQIGISQIGSAQIDSAQIKSSQVNHLSGGSYFRLEQLNSWKVSLPISIPKPQFIRSNFPNHNLTSNLFSNLIYSGTEFWKDLLKPETLFDIDFQIKNLPTGQLAEAQITEYDSFGRLAFFSDLPQYLHDVIEQRRNTNFVLNASLLASAEDELSSDRLLRRNEFLGEFNFFPTGQNDLVSTNVSRIETNSTSEVNLAQTTLIVPNNSQKTGISHVADAKFSKSQVGSSEICPFKVGIVDGSFVKGSTCQIGSAEVDIIKNSTTQIGSSQISSLQVNLIHSSINKANSSQISPTQIDCTKPRILEINSPQIDTTQVASFQDNSGERSFPSSIASEQLFSSNLHNSSPASIYTNNFTALSLWNFLLNGLHAVLIVGLSTPTAISL